MKLECVFCSILFWTCSVIAAFCVFWLTCPLCAFLFIFASNFNLYRVDTFLSHLEDFETCILKQKCCKKYEHVYKKFQVTIDQDFTCIAHALCRFDARHTRTILFLHGTGSGALSFANCLDVFSTGYNIIALDLLGFGRSVCEPRPSDSVRQQLLVSFVHEFLLEMNIRQVVLIGHSFGAFIAGHFADQHPACVSKLVLACGAGLLPTLGKFGCYFAVIFKFSLLHVHKKLGKGFLWLLLNVSSIFGFNLEFCYWLVLTGQPENNWGHEIVAENISLSFAHAFWREPILPILCRLDGIPILTIYGQGDVLIPANQGLVFEKCFGWKTLIFEKSGHSLFVENSQDIFDFVSESASVQTSKMCKIDAADFCSFFSLRITEKQIRKLYVWLQAISFD